jgi:hypothetical protein
MTACLRSLNRYTALLGRWAFGVLALVLGSGAHAQKAPEIDYSVLLAPAFSGSQIKFVQEALLAHDPNCLVWPDEPTQRVVVRTSVPLVRAALQQQIAAAGLEVVSVDLVLPDDPQQRRAMILAAAGFPQFHDTGDPEQDQNAFATAKAAWIDADPARYEALLKALNGNPTEAR